MNIHPFSPGVNWENKCYLWQQILQDFDDSKTATTVNMF